MEISFATEALKEACLARKPDTADLPEDVLRALHVLYNVLRNAEDVGELPLGKPEPGELSSGFEWRIDLVNGYRMVLRANHTKLPGNEGVVEWSRVYRVQVMAIEAPRV
jgi:hypothetical protein